MSAASVASPAPAAPGPSMLDLVRLSPRRIAPPGGEDLLRQIARLSDLQPGEEVLSVACGAGVGLQFFVEEYQAQGSGVETDSRLVERANAWAREAGAAARFQVQAAPPGDLPFRDDVFHLTVGELGLTADDAPDAAVAELVRVTRPGGLVVLMQPVWKAPVDEDRRRVLASHLGVQPLMVVEWKRLLKASGLVEIQSEDWSHGETAFRKAVRKPFPDFAELFSFSEKLGILRRAWGRWGWRGVVTVLLREAEVHRLLTRDRLLGFDLVRGRKPLEGPTPGPEPGPEADPENTEPATSETGVDDLPLFQRETR